ncbi:FimV/HubP family polar landmark protein [Pseudohaliea rubra]|uniref:LysM domain-containing protein n=1 Tax=Pseudohaliea rubra DSM 19751 TaxID=1265313 RepID=A0A095X091_9GAMM|nr:FimV/HubP family polar landmark protein [Pseudohaliea rubra]KGE04304.1 hypothetical protein HRUBRA_01168 [Pseudohaliea rubra DSM 19751]
MAKRVQATAVLLAGGLLHAGQAAALGLGEMSLSSFLNEPLDAEVSLLDTRGLTTDDIRIRLAGVEDFERLGINRNYFLTSIDFRVSVDPATGRGVIRLSTDEPVVEPFLDLIIEARWPSGRLLREYTVLVDPPAFREEVLTVSASARVAETEAEEASASTPPGQQPETPPEPQTRTGERGDRVQVLDSDLPPGEMPRRPFSAATVDEPQAGSRYLVKRDETLWQIARGARPEGVSVQQAMLDIQRLNPEAFIDGNINRLKAGYIIYLPRAGDISSDDVADALAEVQAQNSAWSSGRSRTPGVTAAATLRISADSGGSDAPTADDTAEAVAAEGQAQQEAATAAVERAPAPSPPEPDSPEPDPVAAATTASPLEGELAAQLAAMAGRLDALEATLSVKDQEIARLEDALREARDSAQAAAAARARAEAPAEPVARAPVPAPASSAASGFMPWVYGIAGAVVLVLLAVLGFRRRRRSGTPLRSDATPARPASPAPAAAADDDVFAGVTLREDAVDMAAPVVAAADGEEPAHRDVSERGYGERRYDDYIDDADGGDALAEADIYIAYGRYLQAAELLSTAIRSEPENSAFRLKLLELYTDMGESDKALEQLEALREHGAADAVARAERIVGGAAPAPRARPEPAASPAGAVEPPPSPMVPEPAPGPGPEVAPEPQVEPGSEEEPGPESASDPQLAQAPEPAPEVPGAAAPELADDDSVFDGLAIEEEPPAAEPGEVLDLDLELEEPLTDPVEASEAVDFGAPPPMPEAGGSESDEDLVFADEGDQIATRLDLARAYLDMGDSDGARSILQEVVRDGNADQQEEANTLLARLG